MEDSYQYIPLSLRPSDYSFRNGDLVDHDFYLELRKLIKNEYKESLNTVLYNDKETLQIQKQILFVVRDQIHNQKVKTVEDLLRAVRESTKTVLEQTSEISSLDADGDSPHEANTFPDQSQTLEEEPSLEDLKHILSFDILKLQEEYLVSNNSEKFFSSDTPPPNRKPFLPSHFFQNDFRKKIFSPVDHPSDLQENLKKEKFISLDKRKIFVQDHFFEIMNLFLESSDSTQDIISMNSNDFYRKSVEFVMPDNQKILLTFYQFLKICFNGILQTSIYNVENKFRKKTKKPFRTYQIGWELVQQKYITGQWPARKEIEKRFLSGHLTTGQYCIQEHFYEIWEQFQKTQKPLHREKRPSLSNATIIFVDKGIPLKLSWDSFCIAVCCIVTRTSHVDMKKYASLGAKLAREWYEKKEIPSGDMQSRMEKHTAQKEKLAEREKIFEEHFCDILNLFLEIFPEEKKDVQNISAFCLDKKTKVVFRIDGKESVFSWGTFYYFALKKFAGRTSGMWDHSLACPDFIRKWYASGQMPCQEVLKDLTEKYIRPEEKKKIFFENVREIVDLFLQKKEISIETLSTGSFEESDKIVLEKNGKNYEYSWAYTLQQPLMAILGWNTRQARKYWKVCLNVLKTVYELSIIPSREEVLEAIKNTVSRRGVSVKK